MAKEKILIVENNPTYLEVAKSYFSSLPVRAGFATNYELGKAILPNCDGSLIDLFIPENETERVGKEGKELNKGLKNALKKKKASCLTDVLDEDEELHKPLLKLVSDVSSKSLSETNQSSLGYIVNNFTEINIYSLDRDTIRKNQWLMERLHFYHPELNSFDAQLISLTKEEKLGHSPLGIKLAKMSEQLGDPFVFVTDGYHNHSRLGAAIRGVFFEDGSCKIIDAGYRRKDQIDFWQGAYKLLLNPKLTQGLLSSFDKQRSYQ